MGEPKRIQGKRAKGWRMPEGAVYVGRPTVWGNPYIVDNHQDRTAAVAAFRCLMEEDDDSRIPRVFMYPAVAFIRDQLGGRDLACWCPLDQPCHADVLLAIANPAGDPA